MRWIQIIFMKTHTIKRENTMKRCNYYSWLLLLFTAQTALAQIVAIVTNPGDAGKGSLRAAIEDTNKNKGGRIEFNIDPAIFGPGPWTIDLQKRLPYITQPTHILGFSQPGSKNDTGPGFDTILIEVSGVHAPQSGFDGLVTFYPGATGSSVSGLSLFGNELSNIIGTTSGLLIHDNFIGVRADRKTIIKCSLGMAIVMGSGSKIYDNVISCGTHAGLAIDGSFHTVSGNWLGLDPDGVVFADAFADHAIFAGGSIAYPNPDPQFIAPLQQIFFGLRDSRIERNFIVGAKNEAIVVAGAPSNAGSLESFNNVITGNVVGFGPLGNNPGNNVGTALRIDSSARNTQVIDNIFGNATNGILLGKKDATSITNSGGANTIRRNYLLNVQSHAIGLDPANNFNPLANDALDADGGSNNGQNKPELTYANVLGQIEGIYVGAPNRRLVLDFYRSQRCDSSGYGGGETYMDEATISTDANGNASFSLTVGGLPVGGLLTTNAITATATDAGAAGMPMTLTDTSEFSNCVTANPVYSTQTILNALPDYAPAMDNSLSLRANVSNSASTNVSGTVRFFANTSTGQIVLGNATLVGNQANLNSTATGLLPRSGRYQIHAEYLGDRANRSSASGAKAIVVFRPPTAVLLETVSSLLRFSLSGMRYELFDVSTRTWRPLSTQNNERILDTAQFQNSRLDQLISVEPSGQFALTAGGSRRSAQSRDFRSTDRVFDFGLFDDDSKFDALVRNGQTNTWQLTSCAFDTDSCEKTTIFGFDLDVPLTGDFNGDGKLDILWSDSSGRAKEIMLLDGARILDRTPITNAPADALALATGDFNGDGYEDIAWYSATNRTVTVWFMDRGYLHSVAEASGIRSMDLQARGPTYFAARTSPNYGHASMIWRDGNSGDVFEWSAIEDQGGRLNYADTAIFSDPNLDLLKTR
jgi:Bacterial Ig-like domain (group 3)/FG-GAP-like repeat